MRHQISAYLGKKAYRILYDIARQNEWSLSRTLEEVLLVFAAAKSVSGNSTTITLNGAIALGTILDRIFYSTTEAKA